MCRAVLAAPRAGGPEAGFRGESGPAAQHRLGGSRGGHPLQDGVPSEGQVSVPLRGTEMFAHVVV